MTATLLNCFNISLYGFLKKFLSFLLILFAGPSLSSAQLTGGSDRTQQELNFLTWATGIRLAYCQNAPIIDLVDPFREAVAKMINRYCRNATACGLKKTVAFTKHQVVILDTYPRREHRALNFRFYIVLPHDAEPLGRKPDKPLIPQKTMTDILQTQISELTHILGWQVLSYERYPRFDPMTTFMNRALIPIAIVAALCMLFLAYWSSTITSGSSIYGSGDGWMVSGSTGGKNAALRRTLEIIEEQKFRFAQYDAAAREHRLADGEPLPSTVIVYKSNARVQGVRAPPRSLATSIATRGAMPHHAAPLQKGPSYNAPSSKSSRTGSTSTSGKSASTDTSLINAPINGNKGDKDVAGSIIEEESEAADVVPEIVVMHRRDSSMDTAETGPSSRRVSVQGHRRQSRRFSILDDFKRKKPVFGGGRGQQQGQKRWKAGSLMFSKFGSKK
ncbi:hypothetical protein DdX_18714 [Ditylenchus destructor]|uniref:DUF8077 domain-containing protein n=1 Tax=Ditylenchus destructor TaxID=166010 RepID=A0AAD4MJ56_9BILA|nr:hypothetical protein DdX_18714 [Ditylenchus destructor]